MKRKLVSLLCIFALTATMLTGCVHINVDFGNNDPIDQTDPDDDDDDDDIDITDGDDDSDTDITDIFVEVPDADTVLRFWADNYDDIAAGVYTGSFDYFVFLSPIDLDCDTMPELLVQFSNDSDPYNTTFILDVDPSLSKIVCVDKYDSKGAVVDDEVPFEPFMIYDTPSGDRHFIVRYFYNEGGELSGKVYTDICFRDDNDSYIAKPIVTKINECKSFYRVSGEEGVLDYEEFYDGNGNEISEKDYFGKYGLYSYSEKIGACSVYHVSYNPIYLYFGVDDLYEELKSSYESFTLTEKSIENPVDVLEGTWTIYSTSIEGDDMLWDSAEGSIDITFYDDELCFYDFSRGRSLSYVDLEYYIEYTGYYAIEELWTVNVEDFSDYEWISLTLNEDGLLYLSAIIRYNEYDYASIYYGFRRVAD